MEIELRHNASFGVGRCLLEKGEEVKVEAGAMMAHSYGLEVKARLEGGPIKGIKRAVLGNESLYVSTFAASRSDGWVDVAARLPGDVRILELDGNHNWAIERGNWLASENSVNMNTKWQGFKMLAGGEGGFMMHASGKGKVLVSSYGAIDKMELGDNDRVVIDTGHVLAFTDTMDYKLKRSVAGRTIQTLKTGEGMVFHFLGPGEVLTQTRDQSQLVDWLENELGSRE